VRVRALRRSSIGVYTVLAAMALMLTLPSVARADPVNDNFADAQTISGGSVSVNGTTAGATREVGEPDHYTSNAADASSWVGDHSVWYRWTAPSSGPISIDTCQTNIDSILAIYTGGSLGGLSRVADNNNNYCGGGWGSKVTFEATSGTAYQIAVGDAGGLRENTFTLKLEPGDLHPPNTTASAVTDSGATYASGSWTSEDVEVTLNSQDNEDGSSVKELTYYATGAQPIRSTTMLANELPKQLPINIEGTTTISYFATDNAGNQESPAKTFTVKIDKSAPTLDTDSSDGADGVTPNNKQTGVSRSIEPKATFSDEMNQASLSTSAELYQWNSKQGTWRPVAAAVSVEGNTATLDPYPTDPARLLAANKRFKVTFTTGAKNVVGISLESTKSWTFTTGTHAYSAVGDFSATQNPSGAWSYGYLASAGSGFALYTNHANPWGPSFDQWSLNSSPTVTPHVTFNRTGQTASYSTITHPPNVLNLHPGPIGQKSVVRWTAPSSMTVTIEGRFEGIDRVGTTTDVAVVHNSARTLFSGNINGYGAKAPFSITKAVAAGDPIDFSVGYGSNANHFCDSTGLSATISY
jgi:hypothetical protein